MLREENHPEDPLKWRRGLCIVIYPVYVRIRPYPRYSLSYEDPGMSAHLWVSFSLLSRRQRNPKVFLLTESTKYNSLCSWSHSPKLVVINLDPYHDWARLGNYSLLVKKWYRNLNIFLFLRFLREINALFNYSKVNNWFHVKSVWKKNSYIFTLCLENLP